MPASQSGRPGITMPTSNPPGNLPADLRDELKSTFGIVPSFANVLPPEQFRLWWTQIRDFQLSDQTALDGKTKELIGLGVSAQIPCHYCVLFHTEAARLNGASEQEIQEAVFMASLTRQGSTILNGTQVNEQTFDKELQQVVAYLKKKGASTPSTTVVGGVGRKTTVSVRQR